MLEALGVGGASTLVVLASAERHFETSARNLPGVSVLRAEGLNVYDVLRHKKLVIEQAALPAIATRLGRAPAPGAAATVTGASA